MHIHSAIDSLPTDQSHCELMPGQKALFFLHTLGGKAQCTYNEPLVYTLKGPVLLAGLQGAVDALVKRHPMLRAHFRQNENGDALQYIDDNARVEIRCVDSANQAVPELINEEIVRPFDLNTAPLLRVLLISTSPNEHMLVMVFHHIIIDGASLAILIKDFSTYYNQLATGSDTVEQTPATLQYIDSSSAQQQHRLSKEYQDKVAAVADTLRGHNELNFLPSPTYPAVTDPFAGDRVSFSIEADLYEQIKTLAKAHKVTVFHVLLAAYSIFISKYTHTKDIVVGTPFTGRNHSLERDVVGYYVNTMPIRISLSETNQTFRQLLSKTRNTVFSCLAKQDVVFEDIAPHLDLPRKAPGRHPLIQTVLNWETRANSVHLCLHDIEASLCHTYFSKTAKFDLSLFLLEEAQSISAFFEYQTLLFDQAMVQQFAARFCTLLRQLTSHPDHTVSSVRLLDADDEQQMAKTFFAPAINNSQPDTALTGNLSTLFTQVAQRYGTHSALSFDTQCYSYQEVSMQAERWARYIRARYTEIYGTPMPTGTLIALCLPRHPDMIFAILGVLKAGGAYVPIDPLFPKERIDYILDDSQATLLLTHQQCCPANLNTHIEKVIFMDDASVQDELAAQPSDPLPDLPTEAPAYVIYTSGSTGKPKGVLITHANVLSLFRSVKKHVAFSEQDVWSLFHTYCFDASVWEIWGALLFGGKLVIVPYDTSRDPEKFHRLLDKQGVTMLMQTPLAFQMVINEDMLSAQKLPLRYIFFGGETLKLSTLRPWVTKYGTDTPVLVNMYGATETTVHITYKAVNSDDVDKGYNNIGNALDEYRVSIMDDTLHWCPVGMVGEICVGGGGLAQGYINRKELTAEKFVKDPYAALLGLDPNEKIYRTGDLGRWMPDGSIEYIGRKDFQVKLRGFRIELGEIEAALGRFEQVAQALVLLKGEGENAYLSAYYTAKVGHSIDTPALRKHLQTLLPEYMVPQRLAQLKSFPITINGKIDRNILYQYDDHAEEKDAPVALTNQLQQDIADIWANVLKIDQSNISLHSNFFSLGGNSLLLIKAKHLLQGKFAIDVPIVELFQHTTLQELAVHVANRSSPVHAPENIPVPNKPIQPATPLDEPIAIVGMACRLPQGITDPDAFWQLLISGSSTIADIPDQELAAHHPDSLWATNDHFVKRAAVLSNTYDFDAGFFGYSGREAELMDPQQRHFLECAWQALEHSGNVPDKIPGDVGVFASQGKNYYYDERVSPSLHTAEKVTTYQAMIANEKDFLATRASFKINLTGPSITLQTGCSSSLVAVNMACNSLRIQECDMALAGGVSLFPRYGYFYQEGLIESPDGFCRPFDAQANGTVAGSGIGVVVLKRLSDAIATKDTIYAVIKGWAVNNDGANKIGYTAPSIAGQSAVIQKALHKAGVSPDAVDYVEAHGTATPLGDPIEVAALHQVYAAHRPMDQSLCAIGSVKSNIGHTDAASGVLGLIKSVLMIQHKTIPPTLHFQTLNPEIVAFNQVFYVPNQIEEWEQREHPRCAAISSFGIGGTNAHTIIQEYIPRVIQDRTKTAPVLVPFSAKTKEGLETLALQMRAHLRYLDAQALPNIAFTAQQGRVEFAERGYIVAEELNGAAHIHTSFIRDYPKPEYPSFVYKLFPQATHPAHSLTVQLKLLTRLCELGIMADAVVLPKGRIPADLTKQLDSLQLNFTQQTKDIKKDTLWVTVYSDEEAAVTGEQHSIFSAETKNHEQAWLNLLGRLWAHGIAIPWTELMQFDESVHKTSVPTYPFVRQTYVLPKPAVPTICLPDEPSLTEPISTSGQSAIHDSIRTIWSTALGLAPDAIDDEADFFDLGGDSMSFIDVFAHVKKTFALDIILESLLPCTTLRTMVLFVENI